MTQTELIDALKLPHHEIARIKAARTSCEDFDRMLRGSSADDCPSTPFHEFVKEQVEDCVTLIAQILNESPSTVMQTLLGLFGLTEHEFNTTSASVAQLVALSVWVKAQQP